MKKIIISLIMAACLVFVTAADVYAQTKQRVRFARGTSSATGKGTVRGFAYRDYIVGASGGQTIDVKLTSSNSVLTIFLPNGDNLEGASETDEFAGELPTSGDYVIRVGMMRTEARRPRSVSSYTLKISIR